MNVEALLREMLVDHLGVDPERVKADATIVDDLGAESLDLVELVIRVEEEFDITIDNEAWLEADTFGKIVALVEGLVKP